MDFTWMAVVTARGLTLLSSRRVDCAHAARRRLDCDGALHGMPAGPLMATTIGARARAGRLPTLPLFILGWRNPLPHAHPEDMFHGSHPGWRRFPGVSLHSNGLGAASSLRSRARRPPTAATIGRITNSELLKRGYEREWRSARSPGRHARPPDPALDHHDRICVAADVSIARLFVRRRDPGHPPHSSCSPSYIAAWAAAHPHRTPAREADDHARGEALRCAPPHPGVVLIARSSARSTHRTRDRRPSGGDRRHRRARARAIAARSTRRASCKA